VPVAAPPIHRTSSRPTPLRIGFLDLIDAAPLIVARERGFFADEGLDVRLERQLGWGSIRDRLTFGQLDAAHALLGMPLYSHLRRDRFLQPLIGVMNLGAGGNAITLSRRLIDAGVQSAATLAEYVRRAPQGSDRIVLGHVFDCSMHHYLLRDWLAAGGADPDRDLALRVFPPSQLAAHLTRGYVDGFCVGEPWNTLAERAGAGRIVALTTDVLPAHPEKVLAVTRPWLESRRDVLEPMIRAILRGCAYCEQDANEGDLAELLARPGYLNADVDLIGQSLKLVRPKLPRTGRPRSAATNSTFPSKTHYAWVASQMRRWGLLPENFDATAIAGRCADTTGYRAAAASLGLDCPPDDFPAMPLRHGAFAPDAGAIPDHSMEGATL
jgi:two-component system, oxyanion-binding sensor